MGNRFGGSIEQAARILQEALAGQTKDADLREIARNIVADHKANKKVIGGLGHPIHKPIDPRTPKLFAIADENGFSGRYVKLIELIGAEATAAYGRELPVNATGAIGAIASELDFNWRVCRGLAVMARAIGLVGHLQEEMNEPMSPEIWARVDQETSGDRALGQD
jgi:citrate synthase